jgi:S1-C subfamily serine protease
MIAKVLVGLGAMAMAVGLGFSSAGVAPLGQDASHTSTSASQLRVWYGQLPPTLGGSAQQGASQQGSGQSGTGQQSRRGGYQQAPSGGQFGQQPSSGTSGTASTAAATTDQATGLVLINTEVDFGSAMAAGTGMVIDSDGIVVTNHHVVAGSTTVSVTVPSTNQTYDADVLGYDAVTDVAVLQLEGASNLTTVTADTSAVAVGDTITAVGNAEGGGQLIAAPGTITATGQDITVTEDDGSTAPLSNLIAVSAALVPGDSGGALLDKDGEVVGMNVAGSTNSRNSEGFAIPITDVQQVANSVLNGIETDNVILGRTAALGVEVSNQTTTVSIVGVISGGPAQTAGITAGSTITAIDGTQVAGVNDLTAVLSSHKPGDRVSVTWTDSSGSGHQANITLTQAPLA